MDLGKRLRFVRQSRGLTVDALSKMSGLSCNSITNYEFNLTNPMMYTVQKIADALGMSLDELIGRKDYGPLPDIPGIEDLPKCKRLCVFRMIRGKTVDELVNCGIGRNAAYRYDHGQLRMSADSAIRIANYLDISLDWIF